MKKGLLSILAGALLVVGCQNYDDQFESIENSINAINTQIAGLTQVQSEVQGLTATVASLLSTVNSLPSSSDIATQLSDGLAGIISDVADLEASLDAVASSEEVTDLTDAVADAQTDLDELLANSAVFQGNVIVNNTATLATFHALKSSLLIVNGYVDIDAKADMDATLLQELVDAIQITTKQFDYQAATSTVGAVTFNNLAGTQTLTVLQAGDYLFQGLGSATVINLKDDFKSKVTKIDFRELTSVSEFQTSGTANTISFNKAVELHLTKLAFYAPLDLTIVTDEGAAMPFIIDDVDVDGDQSNITLDITGPASFTATNLEDGTLTFKDVATVDVDGFEGGFTISSGVESFSADKVSALTISGASDLETLDITGITDPDSTTDQSGPAISLTDANNGDLETVTIAGNTGAIAVAGDKITTVTISADAAGSINVSDSDDLTTLTLTGSKATGVTVSGNDSLSDLTVDTTITKGRSTTAALTAALKVNGSVVVTTNESLESLTITSSSLKTLTITGNEVLTSLTATGIAAVGVTAGAAVNVYGNNFTATKSADSENTATTLTATGAANDLGAFTTTSGLETLKAYLALVVADTAATASVYFDTVESYVGEDGVEDGTDATYSSETTRDTTTASDEQRILVLEADNSVASVGSIAAKKAFVIDLSAVDVSYSFQFTDGTNDLLSSNTDENAATAVTLTGTDTPATALSKLQAGTSVERAAIFGITYAAKRGGNSYGEAELILFAQSATTTPTSYGERYETDAARLAAASNTDFGGGTTSSTAVTFKVGADSVTVTSGVVGTTTTAVDDIGNAIAFAWDVKYGTTGTASTAATFSVSYNASTDKLNVTTLSSDSAGYDAAMVLSGGGANLDYIVGPTVSSSDNSTIDADVIVTFESTVAGIAGNKVSSVTSSTATLSSGIVTELTNNYYAVTTTATETFGRALGTEARTDVINAEDGSSSIASTALGSVKIR